MSTSKHVTGSSSGDHKSDLWLQAYEELKDEDKGKEKLRKLEKLLVEKLKKPGVKLRSEEGYQQLRGMIKDKAQKLESKKGIDKTESLFKNMMLFQDIVAAGAGVGGPYVAIPAAALFSVFTVSSSSHLHNSDRLTWYQDGRNLHGRENSYVQSGADYCRLRRDVQESSRMDDDSCR
jgi:hypothetical protein